jgi:hypothetical protein
MATYQSEAARIARQRAIADALRASGNEALPASIRTGGRFDAAVSPWQHANKAMSTLLGAYQSRKADESQKTLDAEDKKVLDELLSAKRNAELPASSGGLANPDDPNMVGPTRDAPPQMSQAERKAKLQAAVMAGLNFGGSSTPYAQEITQRELFPPVQDPYTLRNGDGSEVRFTGDNKPVASSLPDGPKESPEDRMLINVADPTNAKGYRTIKRSDWQGEQLYEKPTGGAQISVGLTGNTLDLAAERYRVTGSVPPGLGRSPEAVLKIIKRAGEMAALQGDDAGAAVIRQQEAATAKQALGQLAKQEAMVGAFEKTAMTSLNIAEGLSKKVNRAGVPVVDRWINAGRKKIAGDVEMAQFHTATETFVQEYAKIISGSMGNTPVSDSAREHARELLNTAMTGDQYAGVVDILKQEMAGRIKSFTSQRQELYNSLGARNPNVNPHTPQTPAPTGDDFSSLWNQ